MPEKRYRLNRCAHFLWLDAYIVFFTICKLEKLTHMAPPITAAKQQQHHSQSIYAYGIGYVLDMRARSPL